MAEQWKIISLNVQRAPFRTGERGDLVAIATLGYGDIRLAGVTLWRTWKDDFSYDLSTPRVARVWIEQQAARDALLVSLVERYQAEKGLDAKASLKTALSRGASSAGSPARSTHENHARNPRSHC